MTAATDDLEYANGHVRKLTVPKPAIGGIALVVAPAVLVLALTGCDPASDRGVESTTGTPAAGASAPASTAGGATAGFIYGRVTTDGGTYEGRLRWGGDQEAFWDDLFDGLKRENPWRVHAPGRPGFVEIFGLEIGGSRPNLERAFLARFGDIARIDAHFRQVQVTRTSGTVVTLDRFAAGDIDDGVRVWDRTHGIVDLDTRQIRRIEFLPPPPLAGTPERLYGVVTARQREFTGFIQWHQRDGVSTDALEGVAAGRDVSLRYDTIRSIVRHARNAARVILRDGGEVVVSNSPEAGQGHRGVYVEDMRYGRVLIPWDAFERVDFSSSDSGPGYADFPPGRPLTGTVITSDGRRLAGRLVYDFDESETTDTFDVSDGDVAFNIPLGRIASIVPRPRGGDGGLSATITLHGGEQLHLERNGDLGKTNAGMLIFVGSREHPEHVPFSDVERIELDGSNARSDSDRDARD